MELLDPSGAQARKEEYQCQLLAPMMFRKDEGWAVSR